MKTNKKNGVIIGVGAVCLAYILGKTKGSIKTLEEIDKKFGSYFPENTVVHIEIIKKLFVRRTMNEVNKDLND